jgi:hypothetical protein
MWLNMLKVSTIEHFLSAKRGIMRNVKTKELTPKQILSVPCITCGATIGEACELHTGALRFEPHRDRKLSAAETVRKKSVSGINPRFDKDSS